MSIKRYAPAVHKSDMVAYNNVLYVSGIVSDLKDAQIEQQTVDLLSKIDVLLEKGGSSKKNLLSAMIWLTSIEDRIAFNKIWSEWLPKGELPARACVGAVLAEPGLKVEVALVAAQDVQA